MKWWIWLVVAIAVFGIGLVLLNLPDLNRYRKIRNM